MREIDVCFDPERKLFLYFGVAFLAVAVGPFGTYEAMTLWQRTAFWMLDILGAMLIVVPILHVFFHSRLAAVLPAYPRFFLGIALGAIPTAAYISVLWGVVGRDLDITTPFPVLYLQVTAFSTILLLTEFVLWPLVFGDRSAPSRQGAGPVPPGSASPGPEAPEADTTGPGTPQGGPDGPALLGRLPQEYRNAEIVSISMQDHYAEVTTTAGSALVLIRLGDAIELLQGCPGLRIHRSHWVARQFVEYVEKAGRRAEVVLKDGRRLPVGNTYLDKVRSQFPDGMGADRSQKATRNRPGAVPADETH